MISIECIEKRILITIRLRNFFDEKEMSFISASLLCN